MQIFIYVFSVACMLCVANAKAQTLPEQILGRWISDDGDFVVDVFKSSGKYGAKLVWYDDHNDKASIEDAIDDLNPNLALRTRKVLGIDVLRGLTYNPKNKQYENGLIYDATTGKEWTSYIYFNPKGHIVVKGYWHFKFLCQSLLMKRYEPSKGNGPILSKNNYTPSSKSIGGPSDK